MDITGLPKFTIRGEIRPAGDSFLPGAPSTSADDVRDFINANPEAKTLVFEISSFGGSLNQGFEMHDLIKGSGKKIVTIGYTVCSAAVLPFLAGDKRLISENADFVIHPARIMPENLGTNPLTAQDFQELAQSIQMDDKKIIDAYCSTIGEDKRSKVLAYFSQETNLGAKKAIQLGFANGYWKKKAAEPISNSLFFGIDSFTEEKFTTLEISNYLSHKIMDAKELKALHDKQTLIEKALNKLVSLFGKSKNDAVLSDTSGAKLGTVVSADANLVGKVAVEYDGDGLPTQEPLDDGTYTDDAGNTVVISGGAGVVESVTPKAGNAENEALKKEIEALKAAATTTANEKTVLENKIKELEGVNKTTLDTVNKVKADFDEFKKLVPGDPKNKDPKQIEKIEKEAWDKMTNVERMYHARQNMKKLTTV